MERDWVVLTIDDKHMWASLAIKKPVGDEDVSFSAEFIEGYLKENGIVAGINQEAIQALGRYVAYDTDIVVAQGKPAINGKDGIFEYLVPLEDVHAKPVVNPDGSVDYANSLKLATVDEDQLFAVYVPPTPGEFGYTIFSEILKPMPGKPARPLRGKGFHVSEDEKEYRADFPGRIYRENNRIIVDKLYVVNGDLGIEQGNVRFNGDVEVRGDVHSGMLIEASGDIFVNGHVGNCVLNAGGNITIGKGVQGKYGCQLIAGQDIAASFVEHCSMRAQGNIYANSLLDCNVYARGFVVVNSKLGHIIGGIASGFQGVEAKQLGNEVGVKTIIRFGETAEYQKKIHENTEKIKIVEKELAVLKAQLDKCDSLMGKDRNRETEALRMQIVRARVVKTTDYNALMDENETLHQEIVTAVREARVKVPGIVYPGVILYNDSQLFVQNEACREVEYLRTSEGVVMRSLEEDKK